MHLGVERLAVRIVSLPNCFNAKGDAKHKQDGHRQRGGTSDPSSPSIEPDVLTLEVVLGDPVNRRAQIGDCVSERCIVEVEIGFRVSPPKVDAPGFVVHGDKQRIGHGVPHQVAVVPSPLACRHDDQKPVCRTVGQPVPDLTIDPLRARGRRRGQGN